MGSSGSRKTPSTLGRVVRYTAVRATVIFLTVVVAVYATILIANLGGYVDEVVKANIDLAIGMGMRRSGGTAEERLEAFEQAKEAAYEAAGLNEPFLLRCLRWLRRGLTLDWGETSVDSVSWSRRARPIQDVVAENLPRTLLIFGTANLLLFFTTVGLALPLTRKHGSWLDRMVIGLSPLSAAPAWVYGIVLNIASLRTLGSVFGGGTFDAWPDQLQLTYLPMLLRHMALPAAAIFLSGLFHGIYAWRSLFSLHSQEDYVEMARAKGLPKRRLDRHYVLKPLLPSVLTSFAFLFISLWQEVIVLEHVFNVAGIGRLFVRAIHRYDTPVIVALVVTFAYLLGITVFVLDVLYAWVDPRVRVGGMRQGARSVSKKRRCGPGLLTRLTDLVRRGGLAPRAKQGWPEEGTGAGWGGQGVGLSGLDVLEQILGEFARAERVQTDWVTEGGRRATLTVDRLYPEVGLAIRFTGSGGSGSGVGARAGEHDGVVLVEMEANGPVSGETLDEIRRALGAAARRVAQRRGSARIKGTLMPRIAAAKATCEEVIGALGQEGASTVRSGRRKVWKGRFNRGGLRAAATLLRGLAGYPWAAVGLFIILALVGVSVCTMIVLPYDEMITLWRSGGDVWTHNPRGVPPAWVNLFRGESLPSTITMSSLDGGLGRNLGAEEPGAVRKETTVISEDMTRIVIAFPFEFKHGAFPQDLSATVKTTYEEKKPMVSFNWVTPDGREMELASEAIGRSYTYRLSLDERLRRRMDGQEPVEAVFAAPGVEPAIPLEGPYELQVQTFVFEEGGDADAEFVLYGQVHGWAGTDSRRRDLLIPLLWGMPVALAFGIVAAIGTSVSAVAVAGVGTWFGGWVDSLVQRISEVAMLLPILPVSLLVYTLYSKSVWAVLGVIVLLSGLGQAVKSYRAIFLQVREEGYVEAAQAYGAPDRRIVLRYLIPRIAPVVLPQLIILVPSYVFLEATLAVLGVSDPVLPTWGKLIVEGLSRGIHTGELHVLLQPLGLLLLIAIAFILVGVALELVFEPRLRKN